jgi:hypothetical protein
MGRDQAERPTAPEEEIVTTLADKMTQSPARERVISDCVTMIDEEVKSKSGLSGMAIKTGYSLVKAVSPKFVPDVVDAMLDDWVKNLDPFYADWQKAAGGKSFADYLSARGPEAADKLLSVADSRAQRTKHGSVKKMYEKLRPSAKEHVEKALPRLGKLVEKAASA